MLPDKLAALQRKQGLLQQDVADGIGVARQTVSNWEAGKGAPDLAKAGKLAELYHVDLDDLVRDDVRVEPARTEDSADQAKGRDLLDYLVGKQVRLWTDDAMLAGRLGAKVVTVTSCNESWVRVEYPQGTKPGGPQAVELIDLDNLLGFSVVEQEVQDR